MSVREAPNTHTAYAYEAVAKENELLGLALPAGHSHSFDAARLRHEEAEYDAVDVILCQSEFTRGTFIERGIPAAEGGDPPERRRHVALPAPTSACARPTSR